MGTMIGQLGPWNWLILAGLLLLVELAMPGVFFLWLAIAAAVVGVIGFGIAMGWQLQVLLFAVLSVAFVLLLRPRLRDRLAQTADPHINQRMLNYVGQTHRLTTPITNGRGRLSIEDTFWEIEGPEADAGRNVRIIGVHGTRLLVELV